MILSDVQILEQLESGNLGIKPIKNVESQVQPASVDLRLSTNVYHFNQNPEIKVTPNGNEPFNSGDYTAHTKDEKLEIKPGDFVLASTVEKINLPNNLCAVLCGRSRFGRLGVVPYIGAGFVNPGWQGRLALELTNHGPHTVVLTPGETKIIQIVFLRLTGPVETTYGEQRESKYQYQDRIRTVDQTTTDTGSE